MKQNNKLYIIITSRLYKIYMHKSVHKKIYVYIKQEQKKNGKKNKNRN